MQLQPKINVPVKDYFYTQEFQGLDENTISILSPALEQTKKIQRFVGDEYIKAGTPRPSLYEHIINGLDFAKEKIFLPLNSIPKIDKVIEDFNKAFLVHDFGEMIIEFSTFFGRYKEKENKDFPRDKTERSIAEMVLTLCKHGSEQFQTWINYAQNYIKKTSTGGIALAQKLVSDFNVDITTQTTAILQYLNSFVEEWMGYFDLSQDKNKVKNSFVGNLVKVVDKLEGEETARSIHDREKLNRDPDFAKAKILNYLKAYKGLRDCRDATIAMEVKVMSPQKAILNHLDKLIKAEFEKDNRNLAKRFSDFETALNQSTSLAA